MRSKVFIEIDHLTFSIVGLLDKSHLFKDSNNFKFSYAVTHFFINFTVNYNDSDTSQ